MNTSQCLIGLLLAAAELVNAAAERFGWHQAPTISVMTGFIYEPLKPYSIAQWQINLGSQFDADQWVKDFKELGSSHLVFYDKWIDGLVFHETQTTGFKTQRDFVRELAAACHRGGLPLVFYFNALSDGNPEFDEWALRDKQGKPIVFGERWPTHYQTLHSPFRAKSLAQVRELLSNYGPIHGLWHDIFRERFDTISPWTARGYQQMFGEPYAQAGPAKLAEFQARTLADYLDEVEAIRRETHQNQCLYTANASGSTFLGGGPWTERVGARLQYLFNEGHGFLNNERLARMAWALPKSLDINLLLNRSWFTPLEDAPPPAAYSVEQAIAAAAIAVCQGAGVNLALTPGHNGKYGEDLQRAKAVGAWFRSVRTWLTDAQPAADVAIVHGPNANSATDALARAGVFSRWCAPDQPLPACRAVLVLPGSRVDDRLQRYFNEGGTLIAFGNVAALAKSLGVPESPTLRLNQPIRSATLQADSEYNETFSAAHAMDGDPQTAWASASTPMPHWLEIAWPEPVEVNSIEWVSRQGPYRIIDVDLELPEGDGWRVVKSIRGAQDRVLAATLDPSAKTRRIRVKLLRELFQGQERQNADVASLRVLDRAGRDLTGNEDAPEIVRKKVGKGEVILVTCGMLPRSALFWADCVKLAFGEPAFVVSPDNARRYRLILTRVGDARVLHVIDALVPAENYQPASVEIALAPPILGGRSRAALADSDRPLPAAMKNGRLVFTVQPNPVATVVWKGTNQ
jgi:hypothetical protein